MTSGSARPPVPAEDERVERPSDRLWRDHLDQLADNAADAVIVYDAECRIVHANPAAERIFGLSRDELLGRHCIDPAWTICCDGAPVEHEDLACSVAKRTGMPVRSLERSIRHADGSVLSVLVSATPLREDGRIIGVVNTFTDVTKLKRAEAALRENDRSNRSLLRVYERLGGSTSYGAILEALAPEIRKMLGYESIWLQIVRNETELITLYAGGIAEEVVKTLMASDERLRTKVGDDEFLLLPMTDDPYLTRCIKGHRIDVLEDAQTDPITNQPANREIVHRAGNRTIVAVPLMLAGERLGCLAMGTFFDEGVLVPDRAQIDWLAALSNHVAVAMDRVRFLVARREAEDALAKSEEQYRRFVETSFEGVIAQDREGQVAFASDRMAEILARRPDDIVGRPARDLIFEGDLQEFDERMRRRRAGEGGAYEIRFRRGDGSPIWLFLTATPIFDEVGRFEGSFAMATDISQRKLAEQQLERLVATLKDTVEGVVDALSATTSERDPYTSLHQERVSRLACGIAVEMGLNGGFVEALRIAALLHDVGKIAIPSEILVKPATLNDMEMGIVRTHPSVGFHLLENVPFAGPVAKMVLQHHERLDGSGYPDGLVGDETLLEAKILAVADVVEAVSSHRPYRPALGIEAALQEIESGAGTRYAPDVVAACVRVVALRGGVI